MIIFEQKCELMDRYMETINLYNVSLKNLKDGKI